MPAWLLALAAILIAVGAAVLEPDVALAFVIAASVSTGIALFGRGRALAHVPRGESALVRLIVVGIVATWVIGLIAAPVVDARYLTVLSVAVGAGLVGMLSRRTWGPRLVVSSITAHVGLAVWMIAVLPPAANQDVDIFPRDATAALLRGDNPYAIDFENIYGRGTPLYAPEVQLGDRLDVGYPYPPLSLAFAAAGEIFAGDHRYAAAVATGVSAVLVALIRPGAAGLGAALLLAFAPLSFRVVYNGWSEPYAAVFIAASIHAAVRIPRLTPYAVGPLIAAKQYLGPILILAIGTLVAVRRAVGLTRMFIIPITLAAATILPFVVWDAGGFVRSVVEFHLLQPLRPEAVSLPGLLARLDLATVPAWVGFAVAAVALVCILRYGPRTPVGFGAGVAFVYLIFFLTSKQAFMNYYFLVLVALVAGIAAREPEEREAT